MKQAIIFRRLKNNRYSFVPLFASLEETDYLEEIDLISIKKLKELSQYDQQYKELSIAYSFMTFDLDQVVSEMQTIRNLGLKTPIRFIGGGPHLSGDPESGTVMGFDTVFIGDGEETIREYCADILNGHPKKVYDGRVHPVNLENYPPFATKKWQFVIPIEITRGCPFGCKYCAVSYLYGRKPRHRQIQQILEYTHWSVKREKVISRFISPNAFGFQSYNGVTPNLAAIEELLAGLRQIGIRESYFGTFPSDVRPESVTPEVLALVKKYCDNDSLVIGVQTGSERMMQLMKRGHNLETAEQAISLTRAAGLTPMVDFIFGLPNEETADQKATIHWMTRINEKYGAVIHAHTFMPLVGSPWAKAEPQPLRPKITRLLGQLSQKEQLFGSWTQQQQLAQKILRWRKEGYITVKGCCK